MYHEAVQYEHVTLQPESCSRNSTTREGTYPRVVAWTCDNRLVQGRLVDENLVLTIFLELVTALHIFSDPYTQDMKPHPLFLPADCPVRACTRDGRVVRGFLRVDAATKERYVDAFEGRRVDVYDLKNIDPDLLAEVGVGFSELLRCDLKSYKLTSVSTRCAIWIVPATFVEAHVDSWMSLPDS